MEDEFFIDVSHILQDIGAGKGKYYALNFPLRDGMDDECYEQIFQPVITKVSPACAYEYRRNAVKQMLRWSSGLRSRYGIAIEINDV